MTLPGYWSLKLELTRSQGSACFATTKCRGSRTDGLRNELCEFRNTTGGRISNGNVLIEPTLVLDGLEIGIQIIVIIGDAHEDREQTFKVLRTTDSQE